MKLTESQLRKIIREEIIRENLEPKTLTSHEDFKKLLPGDRITVVGKNAVVVKYLGDPATLIYVWEGKSVQNELDAREAWIWEEGELPGITVKFVSHGNPVKSRRPAVSRSYSYYD